MKVCPICKEQFNPRRETARYCSHKCREQAWRDAKEVSVTNVTLNNANRDAKGVTLNANRDANSTLKSTLSNEAIMKKSKEGLGATDRIVLDLKRKAIENNDSLLLKVLRNYYPD